MPGDLVARPFLNLARPDGFPRGSVLRGWSPYLIPLVGMGIYYKVFGPDAARVG